MKNSFTRLTAAAIIGASLMSPMLAVAQTTPSSDEQVKSLMEQIKALQAQLMAALKARGNGMASTTPPMMGDDSYDGMKRPCPAFARDLRRGAQGDDVRELQKHLAEALPDVFSEDKVTGFFGPATEKALMRFQDKMGVGTSTGFFGPKTRNEMGKRCGEMMRRGGMMGSSTMPWMGMPGKMKMMGSTTHPWMDGGRPPMMGSSTIPRPGEMWNWGGGSDDNRGPRPPMHPMMPRPDGQ